MSRILTIAIPKGRILDEALPILSDAGILPAPPFFDPASRALTFDTNQRDVRIIRVRAFDVATFVAHGAAEVGIVGSDVIDEFDYADLYAPVDLGIGHCRLSVAQPAAEAHAPERGVTHVRVATKYPATTRRWYARRGIQAECVKLNGAMEIAPALGLADRIVDLVSSGRTLADNGLVETHVIAPVTARLIVNRAAFKLRPDEVPALVERVRAVVADRASRTPGGTEARHATAA